MSRILIVISVAGILALMLPASERQFVGLTLGSLLFVLWIPSWYRHHIGKIETLHHELAHGLASLASGGRFHRFHIHPDGGGMALTQGGHRHLIVAAGYIGSILFGAIYLAKSAQSETATVFLYVVTLAYALAVLKAGDRHTQAVSVAFACLVGIATVLAPGTLLTRVILNLIGVILVIEGLRSLWTLHLISAIHSGSGSDAEAMAELRGGHPIHWSMVFSVIAVSLLGVVLIAVFALL